MVWENGLSASMSPIASQLPPIRITQRDFERLERLLGRAGSSAQHETLRDELDRADVVEPDAMPPDVVTMNSRVRFRDEATGEVHDVTLVYPEEQSLDQHKMSVLTPVGAALIGLSVGQSIAWHTRLGGEKTLTVLSVEPARRAG
jgi:regulator of nucleoside diphosphate kinase